MQPEGDHPTREREAQSPAFLRTINLCYDAEAPERIAHYHPTAKSLGCLRALAGLAPERASVVVAPYGSGKSITATYLLQVTENQRATHGVLTEVAARVTQVSPELGAFIDQRRQETTRFGVVLALHGYARSVPQALQVAALEAMRRVKLGRQARTLAQMPCDEMGQAVALLQDVHEKVRAAGGDRVLILWDEFGRHLESLLADGRPAALLDLQLLAEFVQRAAAPPMTLGLLLHQDLLRYASQMPQSVRAEWTKVEGRFHTIQYMDDSQELYRLIAAVVAARTTAPPPADALLTAAAARCEGLGLFAACTAEERLDLLRQAYPLEPVTLYLLPRLAARIAQNERTVFSFLHTVDLTQPIGPAVLYDYFASVMRADTAVGGTYRQWLETESAVSKVGADLPAATILKVTCLLGLGLSGERARTPRALLDFALEGYHRAETEAPVLTQLLERKLLLYRRYTDEVTVWHGTDVDLRGRLEDEKARLREHFKLRDFLECEALPPVWRPVAYNDEFCVRRYLAGTYQTLSTLTTYLRFELPLQGWPVGCDGSIVYVLAETAEELRQAEGLVGPTLATMDPALVARLIVALPREPLPLLDTALEVACLLHMQGDAELIETDPLIAPELHQMTDDARSHLQRLLDRLLTPGPQGPRWWHQGQAFPAATTRDLREALSAIMRQVYPLTPKINNEMIVRQRPSPQLINARKKLMLGVLERSGTATLGITGNFPDASMLRTVLIYPGLYRPEDGEHWGYALPAELSDPGVRAVWEAFQAFLTLPAPDPKKFRPFFDRLMDPPYGVRAGLLPILLAAAFQAFPSARVLTRDGAYVADILPSEIERLCREPEAYRLTVVALTAAQRAYLLALPVCLQTAPSPRAPDKDLIRVCMEVFTQWKAALPAAALLTTQLSVPTRRVQAVLRQAMEPVTLLLEALPMACEGSLEDVDTLLQRLTQCAAELRGVTTGYRVHVAEVLRRTLAVGDGQEHTDIDVRQIAQQWAAYFPATFVTTLTDGVAQGVITRLRTPYATLDALLESLASLVVGKTFQRWDDSTLVAFDREFQQIVHRIEDAALARAVPLPDQGQVAQGLALLIRGRLRELCTRLVQLVGVEEAQAMLMALQTATLATGPHTGKADDGNDG